MEEMISLLSALKDKEGKSTVCFLSHELLSVCLCFHNGITFELIALIMRLNLSYLNVTFNCAYLI